MSSGSLAKLTFATAMLALCNAAASFAAAIGNAPSERTAAEIDACVRQNFPDDSMIQTVSMVMTDAVGAERTLEAEMFWEKDPTTRLSNVLLRFENPPELRCSAVLVVGKEPENDMFMYLPEIGRVRRITQRMVSGNMMGTSFSYDDFSRLQGMISSLESERLADEQVAGRAAFVTESRAQPGADYERIRSLIDQETCVPLRVEFHRNGGPEPVKVLTVDPAKLVEEKSHWIPREIHMQDIAGRTTTRLVIEKLKVGVPIDRKLFSERGLVQQGRCRAAFTRY